MQRVKIGEFRDRASELIRRAAGGETVVILHRDRQALVHQPHVKYLLDTQAWLWSVLDHPRLSRRARAVLRLTSDEQAVGLAAISLKEASWHLARGPAHLVVASADSA